MAGPIRPSLGGREQNRCYAAVADKLRYSATISRQTLSTEWHNFDSELAKHLWRPKGWPGRAPHAQCAPVEAVADQLLAGDGYFGTSARYNAQITFDSWEVFRALQAEFSRADWSGIRMCRNIVIEGMPFN